MMFAICTLFRRGFADFVAIIVLWRSVLGRDLRDGLYVLRDDCLSWLDCVSFWAGLGMVWAPDLVGIYSYHLLMSSGFYLCAVFRPIIGLIKINLL
jgi:hypothetical protein